ncbi:hypothetical protein M2227_002530 [Bradyrhizobium elkanii]|uniref:hypothetical protein n=1 Tax=Bradyrhizobium elkanii TaxID=29448 RepID=UPI002226E765|nr:hypothetical protein [Bradyrhizobium elkanii]MCW2200440.1 hypothetical protein [Bradyrhizobium elkanii]
MSKAGRHNEIARRHSNRRGERQFSFATKRIAELKRLFAARYGSQLPDDDAGRDDAFVMANHLAHGPDAGRRISLWLGLAAPWMPSDEAEALIARVLRKPLRWRADTMAKRLNLMAAERQRLGITTIGAVDVDKAERLAKRKERAKLRQQQRRRDAGATTRADYEAQSLSRTKPWEALGMSRRTWYRLGKPGGTSPCAA